MPKSYVVLLAMILGLMLPNSAFAASTKCNSYNYKERKGYVLNFAPGLEITGFSFCNRDGDRFSGEFIQELTWKNTGKVALVAYEMRTILFDPFNRELTGSRAVIPGSDSANWKYLAPGQESEDGLLRTGTEHVHTAIAYVAAVRYEDGKVWTIDRSQLTASVKQVVSTFKGDSLESNGEAANLPPAAPKN